MRVGTHNTSVMKRKLPSPFLLASCPPVFMCYIIVIDDVYFLMSWGLVFMNTMWSAPPRGDPWTVATLCVWQLAKAEHNCFAMLATF